MHITKCLRGENGSLTPEGRGGGKRVTRGGGDLGLPEFGKKERVTLTTKRDVC